MVAQGCRPPAEMSPQQRREEVVSLLARGLLRLKPALPAGPEFPAESARDCLELPGQKPLTVTRG